MAVGDRFLYKAYGLSGSVPTGPCAVDMISGTFTGAADTVYLQFWADDLLAVGTPVDVQTLGPRSTFSWSPPAGGERFAPACAWGLSTTPNTFTAYGGDAVLLRIRGRFTL